MMFTERKATLPELFYPFALFNRKDGWPEQRACYRRDAEEVIDTATMRKIKEKAMAYIFYEAARV